MKVARTGLLVVLGLLCAATLASAIPSNSRWVRIFDFPRVGIAVLLLIVFAGWLATARPRRSTAVLVSVAAVAALAYQSWRLWPYTALHDVEAPTARACPADQRVSVLVANVLYSNRDPAPLLQLVRTTTPDLVLLLETNTFWDRALDDLGSEYPHRVDHPRPEGHGIHLLARHRLVDPEVRYVFEDYRPSIWTGVELPSGQVIGFYGLHPAPPPLKDTARRDAELLIVAKAARAAERPVVVAGDFNDVPWSRTTRLFAEIGGLADPRIGRGPFSTFNANWPLLRWPLDHVFHTADFAPAKVEVAPGVGSDHFPYAVSLCLGRASPSSAPDAEPAQLRAAERVIQAGRAVARTR